MIAERALAIEAIVRARMLRQRLLLASAFCAASAACAQLAGFETLSSKSELPEGGRVAGGGGNGGSLSSAGSAPTAAGTGGTVPSAGSGGMEPLGACNASLLRNGYFDAGPVNWQQLSNAPGILEVSNVIVPDTLQALVDANVQPKSTHYLAWIGAAPNPNKYTRVNLVQAVQIPQNVSKLIISGWIQIKTEEDITTDKDEAFDRLDLALQDPDPNSDDFWSLALWFFTTPTTGWAHFSYEHDEASLLAAVRGRALDFIVEGKFGTSKQTNFWVDSLDLLAECE